MLSILYVSRIELIRFIAICVWVERYWVVHAPKETKRVPRIFFFLFALGIIKKHQFSTDELEQKNVLVKATDTRKLWIKKKNT